MTQTYLIIIVLLAGFAGLAYLLLKKKDEPKNDDSMKIMMEWMKDIKQGTENSKQLTEQNIKDLNKAVNERLDNAARVISQLTKELGGVSQIGPDIRRLAETMASPKMRGNFGEEMLENLLGLVLPTTAFTSQYKFKNGETVDAIIRIGDKIIPIDSKFSMENFRLFKEAQTDEAAESLKKSFLKDIKKRIDEIHKKYILPQENTYDFALMYIPSEAIYFEVADDTETVKYSRNNKVIFVGPNTLYLTLQTFLVSLRGQQVNKAAQQILSMIAGIKNESEKFSKVLDVASRHVKNAGSAMDTINSEYLKLKSNIDNASKLELAADSKVEELPNGNLDKLL